MSLKKRCSTILLVLLPLFGFVLFLGWLGERTAVAAPIVASMTVTSNDSSWADDGQCSLREAIANANQDAQIFTSAGECAAGSGDDTITLGIDVTLTITDNNADGNGNNGLPVVTSTITISGAGHTLSRDNAAPPFRFFYLNNSSSILTLHNITITNGHGDTGLGGVLHVTDGQTVIESATFNNNQAANGGVIFRSASSMLKVNNSRFLANQATAGSGGAINLGCCTGGTRTIVNSLFEGNSATSNGGAISVNSGGNSNIVNSTFINNSANNGGGLSITNQRPASLYNVTIISNTATNQGGGVHYFGGSAMPDLHNSLISGNSASNGVDCGEPSLGLVDAKNNVFGMNGDDGGCNGFAATSANNVTPSGDLNTIVATDGNGNAVLADNGGATETIALVLSSLAINAGDDTLLPNESTLGIDGDGDGNSDDPIDYDQRGFARPQLTDTDAGAYESASAACMVETTGDNVTDYGSGDASALQTAVTKAAPNDLIKIAGTCAGVQTFSTLTQTVYITQSLTLQGGYDGVDWSVSDPDTNSTILDAEGNGRVVLITSGGTNVTLAGLTLTNGDSTDAGGIDGGGGLLAETGIAITLTDSLVNNNVADEGAGVYMTGSSDLTVQNTAVHNNQAATNGGGIYNNSGTLIINSNSQVNNNTASGNAADNGGGGIYNASGMVEIVGAHVDSNKANGTSGSGGGLFLQSGILTTNSNSSVSQNSANRAGGGIEIVDGTLSLSGGGTHISQNDVNGGAGTPNPGNGGGIHVTGNSGTVVTTNNIIVADNQAANAGGGVWIESGTMLTIISTQVNNNTAHGSGGTANDGGGGIFNNGGTVFITSGAGPTTVAGNNAIGVASSGGGLLSISGNVTLDSNSTNQISSVHVNQATINGGGIAMDGGVLALTNGIVTNNSVGSRGGGVWVKAGTATISDFELTNNNTAAKGVGLANEGGVITVTHSLIAENDGGDGGGLFNDGSGRLQIEHTAIINNVASSDGGAMQNFGQATIINSTLSGNEAGSNGGAIENYFSPSALSLIHTTIANNVGFNGDGIYNDVGVITATNTIVADNGTQNCQYTNPITSGDYNLSNDASCNLGSGNDQINTDPMLSPLAENGGNTWTHALLPGSPALNAIPGGNCPVTTDQRDVARPQFGACDIGAYENADSLPPFAAGDGYTTTEEVTLSVAAPGVLSNDNDANGDVITPTLQTNPTNGALVFNNDGSFVYTPTLDFAGIDSFTYMLTDGVLTDMAVVTISVTNVNDAPIALSDTYTATEDMLLTTVAPGVLSNDNDVDGDSLTAVLNTDVTSGTLSLNSDGSFTYTPDSDICGQDSFTYHANDSQADSNTVTVMIDVTCVNDAPLANDDSYNTTEDTMLNIAASGVLTNDTDVEGDGFTAVLDTSTLSGTLSLNGDGSFDYTPDADFCGTDSFTYHANDGQADSNIATATIGVSCVNDAPVAEDDMYSVPEDSINSALAVLVNDSDVDGDALSLTAVTMPSNGTAAISGTIILYSPNINFLGTDVFTYTVSDGMLTDTAVVTISVDNQNDAPTAVDDSYSVSEDSSNNVLDVLVNDSDIDVGDVLSVTAVFFPSNGTATISGTAVLYTPVPDFFGTDVFSYTVSDGALTDTAVVTVTVVNINDGPTAVADAYPVDENSSDNIFAVLANDSDVDGDSLSIVSVDGAGHGTAVISGTNILYTPNLDFVGIDTFTYTISDGNLTAMATITVTVMPLQTGVTIYLPFVTKP